MNSETLASIPEKMNPWISIWIHPKKTFAYLLKQDSRKAIYILAMAYGILASLERAEKQSLGDHFNFIAILGLALVIGAISGIVLLYLFGFINALVSKWLGGKSTQKEMRTVFGWSILPYLLSFIPTIPLIIIFSQNWFISSVEWMTTPILIINIFVGLLAIPFRIWFVVLIAIGIKEVNQFSIWRTFGVLAIDGLLYLGFLSCIVANFFLAYQH